MVADEVITARELLSLIDNGQIRVVDAREPDTYAEGHIPGAVNIHPSFLEHTEVPGIGEPVPNQLRPVPEASAYLRAAGISHDLPVCVYGRGGGYLAARLWWILDYLGHPKPRLLDGGLPAYAAAGGRLSHEPQALANGTFLPAPRATRRAEFPDIIAAMASADTVVCNTLPATQYLTGCIRGSINIPYTSTFADDNPTLLKTRHELEALFADHGVGANTRLICYCQIGYSASQVYFAARYAGFEDVAVYDGSVVDWLAHGGDLVAGSQED